MSIDDQIKGLERELERKKALLSVEVSFGRGNKFSEDIKSEISEKIKEFCMQLATQSETPESSSFTETEVEILKGVAQRVLSSAEGKSKTPSQPTNQGFKSLKDVKKAAEDQAAQAQKQAPKRAKVLLTDNIEPSIRKKVTADTEVQVTGHDKHTGMLKVTSNNGIRFLIPEEDLEYAN
jgi:hypothetical protein